MFEPFGARRASLSRVRHSPPAASMRCLAERVNLSAATESFWSRLMRRTSSVTVPTMTTVFFVGSALRWVTSREMRETEMGGRLVLLIKRRFRMTLLNDESVRRARKR